MYNIDIKYIYIYIIYTIHIINQNIYILRKWSEYNNNNNVFYLRRKSFPL